MSSAASDVYKRQYIAFCYITLLHKVFFLFYTHDSVIGGNIAITMVGMLYVLGTKVTSIVTLLLYTQWGEP